MDASKNGVTAAALRSELMAAAKLPYVQRIGAVMTVASLTCDVIAALEARVEVLEGAANGKD